ncbi:MAG: class II fumarate hydratase [Candidatus Heimdallarchaeota archaeon]|nr:class II fumarate hydratase [Candidatus Heimdallarchaeota archaeon]
MVAKMRLESDLLGELEVPDDVYWGINTQRALKNFQISQKRFPVIFLLSLANIKKACLFANQQLKAIDTDKTKAIQQAIDEILIEHKFLDQFPIDVFQTGSGTQINMNMNEVLANRANEILGFSKGKKTPIHPNDHINKSQSSNDVIPTTMHLSSIVALTNQLLPSLGLLTEVLKEKINEFDNIIKIGRTHLQDAVPIKLATEFSVYLKQIENAKRRLGYTLEELYELPIGGTALGTGLNAPKGFDQLVIELLTTFTKFPFRINTVKAEGISSHNTLVKVSSVLKLLALSLMKMANDIRWMGSGPRAGLSELILPENEPGSSIMPGKINPTQSEALIQVCLQVIGNDTTITYAEGYGSILDLNVTKPLMIVNLLESVSLLSAGIHSFTNNCLRDIKPNLITINKNLENSLMIVTRLTPFIGYEKAGEIAKRAHETGKTIKEIIVEMNLQFDGNLDEILNPYKMV